MSGARRRGLLRALLRGGAVGRRIRVRALLLSSSRRDPDAFRHWVRFEAAKGVIPLIPVVVAGALGWPLPGPVAAILAAAGFGWMIFFAVHAYGQAFRMNRRHSAYVKAIGLDLSPAAVLGNPKVWRCVKPGLTLREGWAEIKAAQAADKLTA